MADSIARLKIRIDSLEADQAGKRLSNLERSGKKAEGAIAKVAKRSKSAEGALRGLKRSAVVAGAALAGAAILATREWLKYDKAIKEVQSITGQATAEFGVMRKEVLALSIALGVDATDAARGLYQALSAGIPQGEEAIAFLKVAAKTAIAGVTSVDTAVDGLTNALNAFKIPVEEAEIVADKFFQTVKDGKTTFEELASNLSKGSVPAAALGISLDELLASIVSITKQGTPTSEAFTQIRSVMTALTNPSKNLLAVYDKLEVTSGRQLIAQHGLSDALEIVRRSFEGQDKELVKALGRVEAYNGILSLTGVNLGEVERAQDNLADSTDAMSGAYTINASTLENALNSLKSSSIGLVEEMENSLGIISEFTEALRGAGQILQALGGGNLTEATQQALNANGAVAIRNLQERRRELTMFQTQLDQMTREGDEFIDRSRQRTFGVSQISAGEMADQFGGGIMRAETVDVLAKVNQELDKVNSKLAGTSDRARALASAAAEVNALVREREAGNITQEEFDNRRLAALDTLKGTQAALTIEAEKEAEAVKATELAEVARIDEKLKQSKFAEEILKAEKEAGKVLDQQVKAAIELATTDAERLQLKLAGIDAAREAGRIDQETADRAQAALLAQALAADTRASGGASARALTGRDLSLGPPITAEEDFRQQQEDLLFQFEENRNLILAQTQLTEEQKTSLILQLTEDRNRQIERIESERVNFQKELNIESLAIFENVLGQFNSIFANAGQEGSAIAKALFLAQKAAAIAGIIVNTELQAALAGAQLGAFGIPLQALIRVQGGISAGLVAGTAIAGLFEHGGMIPAGAQGIVGEAGPELVRGPAVVTSARTTANQMNRGGSEGVSATLNVQVINTAPGIEIETRRSDDQKSVQIIVKQALKQAAQDVRSGVGPLSSALEGTYAGVNRG